MFDDNRPGVIGTGLIYAPAGIGLFQSIARARQFPQQIAANQAVGASSEAALEAMARLRKAPVARAVNYDAVSGKLKALGIKSLEFNDVTMRAIDQLGSISHGALYQFLSHPDLGLKQIDIQKELGNLSSGTLPSSVARRYAEGGAQRKKLFFDILAEHANIDPRRSGMSITGVDKFITRKADSPLNYASRISDYKPLKVHQKLFSKINKKFGGNVLIGKATYHKVSIPGTTGAGGQGVGYTTYAQVNIKNARGVTNIPLESESWVAGKRVSIFHHGKNFQTMFALPRFNPTSDSKEALNFAEALFLGKDNKGDPIFSLFNQLKDHLDTGVGARFARERLKSGDMFDATADFMNPSGHGQFIASLESPNDAAKAIIKHDMLKALWWKDKGSMSDAAARGVIEGNFPGITAAGSPTAASKGEHYIGEPLHGIAYKQKQREIRGWGSDTYIAQENLTSFSNRHGFAGKNTKPWSRWTNPIMSGSPSYKALQDVGNPIYHFSAAYALPKSKAEQMLQHELVGEGGYMLLGHESGMALPEILQQEELGLAGLRKEDIINNRHARDTFIEKRTRTIMAKMQQSDPAGRPPQSFYRMAKEQASREVDDAIRLRSVGPTLSLPKNYRILKSSKETRSVTSGLLDLLAAREEGVGHPYKLTPGEVIGMERGPYGVSLARAQDRVAGTQYITSVIEEGDEWRVSTRIDTPWSDVTKTQLGGKVTSKTYSSKAMGATANEMGITQPTEVIIDSRAMMKNQALLSIQQTTGLQGLASERHLKQFKLDTAHARDVLVGEGNALVKQLGGEIGDLSKADALLFGGLRTAKRMGLTHAEIASVYAGSSRFEEGAALKAQVGGKSVLGHIFGEETEDLLTKFGEQDIVYGQLGVKPTHVEGQMLGVRGSIEMRTIQNIYRSLPEDVAGPIINNLLSRLDTTAENYALAREWSNPKEFVGGKPIVIDDFKDIPESIFSNEERRLYKLPAWAVEGGEERLFAIPSLQELGRLEPNISTPAGTIPGTYRRTVEEMFAAISEGSQARQDLGNTDLVLANSERFTGTARELVREAHNAQRVIYHSLWRGMSKGAISGSTYAEAQMLSLTDPRTAAPRQPLPPHTAGMTTGTFEDIIKQIEAQGGDRAYVDKLRTLFESGEKAPIDFGRHPQMAKHSFQVAYAQRLDEPGAAYGAKMLYFPGESGRLTGPGVDQTISSSFYLGTGRTSDYDFDQVFVSIPENEEQFRIRTKFLEANQEAYSKDILEESIKRQYIGALWGKSESATARGVMDMTLGQLAESEFVTAGGALGNIKYVGQLSNAANMLREAAGRLEPAQRDLMEQAIYGLEEMPISGKHGEGLPLAKTISEDIYERLRTGGRELMSLEGGPSSNAGMDIMRDLFGDESGGGIFRKYMNMGGVLDKGGVEIDWTTKSGTTKVPLAIDKATIDNMASAINEIGEDSTLRFMGLHRKLGSSLSEDSLRAAIEEGKFLNTTVSNFSTDVLTGTNQLYKKAGSGAETSRGMLTSLNALTKKLGAVGKTLEQNWQYISRPLMVGALATAALYNIFGGPGYASEPLEMPEENVDPRIMAAIRAGTLLDDPDSSPGTNQQQRNVERIMSRSNYEGGLTGSSGASPYNGRIYTPSARVAMPSTGRYNLSASANSEADAGQMAQHFQAHMPHARIGLTTSRDTSMLGTTRYQDDL